MSPEEAETDLRALRRLIDNTDARILSLLQQREDLVARVILLKLRSEMPLRDYEREEEIMRRAVEWDRLLRRKVAREIYRHILSASASLARWARRPGCVLE